MEELSKKDKANLKIYARPWGHHRNAAIRLVYYKTKPDIVLIQKIRENKVETSKVVPLKNRDGLKCSIEDYVLENRYIPVPL